MSTRNMMLREVTASLATQQSAAALALPDIIVRTGSCLAVVIAAAISGLLLFP
jgi:hypothetical protein